MKWFIKKTDPKSLWEEDGDLKRMKLFFSEIQSNSEEDEQIKQRIKQKALEKITTEEKVGKLPVANKAGLVQRIGIRLRMISGLKSWKLGISAIGLIILVLIGQGMMKSSINPLLNMGSEAESTQAMDIAAEKRMVREESYGGGSFNDSGAAHFSTQNVVNPSLPVPPDQNAPPADTGVPRKITHDLTLTLEVAAINDSVAHISSAVQQLGGYVVESQQNGSDNHSSARMTLKIPADKLNAFRDSLATWGKIRDQHLRANDITDQYYDSQVRLQTLEAEEKRYLEILNQAKTVEDVLKVENALGNIRQQIEQLKGQIKLWDHMVDYSTVTIQIVTQQSLNVKIKDPWQPVSWSNTWQAAKNAVLKTLGSSWNVFNYLVVGIGYALPYLLVGALGWASYRMWKKRKAQ